MSPAPDWYDDVEHPGYLRFWDGAAWTEHRSPKPAGSSSLPGSAAELSQAAPQQLPDASIGGSTSPDRPVKKHRILPIAVVAVVVVVAAAGAAFWWVESKPTPSEKADEVLRLMTNRAPETLSTTPQPSQCFALNEGYVVPLVAERAGMTGEPVEEGAYVGELEEEGLDGWSLRRTWCERVFEDGSVTIALTQAPRAGENGYKEDLVHGTVPVAHGSFDGDGTIFTYCNDSSFGRRCLGEWLASGGTIVSVEIDGDTDVVTDELALEAFRNDVLPFIFEDLEQE